ncbi:MAG: hypothetical protein ACK5L7_05180 [Paludibacteraceae bacterium]
MKPLIKILLLTLFVSCSSRQFTLNQYSNYPVKYAKQKISYPNDEFTLFIPKDWFWKVEEYDDKNIILGIDAGSNPDKDGFIDILSIQKVRSFSGNDNLKSEYEYLLDIAKNATSRMKLIESGETNILKQKSYFIHTKSDTKTYGESEMISFIIESGEKGVFYYINAVASQTKDLKMNMSILIQSLKTFEMNETE